MSRTTQEQMEELQRQWRALMSQIADALELPRFLRWLNKRLAGDAE